MRKKLGLLRIFFSFLVALRSEDRPSRVAKSVKFEKKKPFGKNINLQQVLQRRISEKYFVFKLLTPLNCSLLLTWLLLLGVGGGAGAGAGCESSGWDP